MFSKNEEISTKSIRLVIISGISLCSSLFYVKIMYWLNNIGFFEVSSKRKEYPFEANFSALLFMFGVIFVFWGLALYILKNTNGVISFLIVGAALSIILILTIIGSDPTGWWLWIINIVIWCILVGCLLEVIFNIVCLTVKNYRQLENKDQFTIGLAIVTFILGFLVRK